MALAGCTSNQNVLRGGRVAMHGGGEGIYHSVRCSMIDKIGWGEEEDVMTMAVAILSCEGAVHDAARGVGGAM